MQEEQCIVAIQQSAESGFGVRHRELLLASASSGRTSCNVATRFGVEPGIIISQFAVSHLLVCRRGLDHTVTNA